MKNSLKIKEIHLDEQTYSLLEYQARHEGRTLKNYLQHILKKQAEDFELTDEYKSMMDDVLNEYQNGKSVLINKNDFYKSMGW